VILWLPKTVGAVLDDIGTFAYSTVVSGDFLDHVYYLITTYFSFTTEDFIAKRNRRLNIWVDFYETQLTDAVVVEFLGSVRRLSTKIVKLAIVGCSTRDRRRMDRWGKKIEQEIAVPVRCFSDPEDAKTWLVGKSL